MSRLPAVVAVLFVLAAGASWRLGIDPNRLGVRGGSAGGHLSLMLGLASDQGDPSAEDAVLRTGSRVAAVVCCPPVDLRPLALGIAGEKPNTRFPALNFDSAGAHCSRPISATSTCGVLSARSTGRDERA